MARKSVEGQLDLFELFSSVEELEESVKGVQWQPDGAIVMRRSFRNMETEETAVIAYLNYNMVYLKDWQRDPVIYEFDNSKDAVDFYVGQMERLSGNKKVKVQKEQCPLEQAVRKKWTGEVEV